MKKKKKQRIGTISSTQVFQAEKPRYNAFQGGCGVHGDTKYNRNRSKKQASREIRIYA